jgi:outer membrane receptor for ferric coprogen and ferric-rhodotorulic acid
VVFTEALQPERAINMGINFTQKFAAKNQKFGGHITLDYYYTGFQNQIFPDFDTDPTQAIISNFYGRSASHGFQAELLLSLAQRWEVKSGYTFLDVYRIVNNQKQLLPFNARHKLLNTLSYKPLSRQFHVDLNVHWFGKQRLPNTQANPAGFQRPDFSQPFQTVNLQFTYNFKTVEAYVGCENMFDFRQRQPIISWQNPFGPYFDTSSVWGPTRGQEFYLGIRLRVKKNTAN